MWLVSDHHLAHAGTSDGRCSWPTVIPAFGQSDGGAPADRFRRTGFMEYPVLVTRSVDLGARELDHLRPFLGAAKPPPIGSARIANTIGIVRVSRARAPITGVVTPKIASGRISTSSFAKVPILSASPAPQRSSIRRFNYTRVIDSCNNFKPKNLL